MRHVATNLKIGPFAFVLFFDPIRIGPPSKVVGRTSAFGLSSCGVEPNRIVYSWFFRLHRNAWRSIFLW